MMYKSVYSLMYHVLYSMQSMNDIFTNIKYNEIITCLMNFRISISYYMKGKLIVVYEYCCRCMEIFKNQTPTFFHYHNYPLSIIIMRTTNLFLCNFVINFFSIAYFYEYNILVSVWSNITIKVSRA